MPNYQSLRANHAPVCDAATRQACQFRALVEQSVHGVTMFDREGNITYASPSTPMLLGCAMDELLGQPALAFVHPDDRTRVTTRLSECVESPPGACVSIIFRVIRRDGASRWIFSEAKNLLDDPNLEAIVSTYRDITKLREVEDEKQQALETLARAIDQTADSVLVTDSQGLIEYVNPAFEKMSGYTRGEVLGRNPGLKASGLTSPQLYRRMWGEIVGGHASRTTMINRRKDGSVYHEDQTIAPIRDASGATTHFVSTGRDISHRRRTEEALRRLNAQLEKETERIAGILHDEAGQFLSAAHMMLANLSLDADPEVRDRLQDVRRNLDEIEERLRRVSREMHPRAVKDLGLLKAIDFLTRSFSRRTGINVTVESSLNSSQRSPEVDTLLYRLVQEGLTNIARHARAKSAVVALSTDNGSVRCSVRDSGVGYDVAASEGHGSGLGLRIMQDRLEAVGGTLTIVSTPGEGTELRASVPLEESCGVTDPPGR